MALRIGVNALYLIPGGVGGTEIYLRHLLEALAAIDPGDTFHVFTNRETTDLVPAAPNFHAAPQRVRAAFRPARIAWEQILLPAAAMRLRCDVLLNPGFTAPVLSPCPQVTVFHDLQHKRHPEYFRWFDLPFWRACLYASARVSRILLADSEPTAADLARYYPFAAGKVRVAPLGVDPMFFGLPRNPQPYFLCVSTLHPHKNIGPLLRAFAKWRAARPGFRLVITGVRGFETAAIERLVGELDLAGSVRLAGWVPREELYELFSGAWAFVYPSTFEGFGLPVLEALAAGVPAACSSIEPLASLAGDAALQFAPSGPAPIEEALERLACDAPLRDRHAAAGPARASRFTWAHTADITLRALRESVQSG